MRLNFCSYSKIHEIHEFFSLGIQYMYTLLTLVMLWIMSAHNIRKYICKSYVHADTHTVVPGNHKHVYTHKGTHSYTHTHARTHTRTCTGSHTCMCTCGHRFNSPTHYLLTCTVMRRHIYTLTYPHSFIHTLINIHFIIGLLPC